MGKTVSAPRLAIVGSDTLIGRELRDLLSEKRLASALELVAGSAGGENVLSEQDGDPVVLKPLRAESFADSRLIFVAGPKESAAQIAAMRVKAPIVDLTGGLLATPGSAVRAPMAEPERYLAPESRLTVIAHPAAILVAMLLRRVHGAAPIRHAAITIFEPATERGQPAVEELQQQTVGLLNLRPFPKAVFDDQLSFNMLSRLGSEAPEPLASTESRIQSDVRVLLSPEPAVPVPSIRLVHAPVFHGYSASVWIDFEEQPDVARLSAWLKSPQVDVRSLDEEAPTNAGVAGQGGIAVDVIQPDDARATAAWFWVVTDNMRLLAENAILAAAAIIEQSRRPVQ